MEETEILKQLNRIFIDILGNSSIVLTDYTSANDIPEWDSLAHIQLIVAIEKHFQIKFTSTEIQNWKNTGQIVESIRVRLNNGKRR